MAKNKGGRPSIYTQKIADEVCRRLSRGESLRSICIDDHLPHRETIMEWYVKDAPKGFADHYARARNMQAEGYVDEILDIADNSANDYMERELEGGRVMEIPDHEHMGRARLRVDSRKWVVSKVLPKKYGDRVKQEIEVTNTGISDALAKLTDKYMKEAE